MLALVVFVLVLGLVLSGASEGPDQRLVRALRARDAVGADGLVGLAQGAREVTALGSRPLLTLLTVTSLGFLLARGRGRAAALLAGSVLAAWGTTDAIKALVGRARPDLLLPCVPVTGASFPSGHASMAAATFLGVAWLAGPRDKPARRLIVIIAAVLVLLVGATRVFLGAHYPTDVVAGWAWGAAWAIAAAGPLQRLRARPA